jgi:hypothetical protein
MGGPITVSCTRRLVLSSGLFYGLLALAGCSDSSSSAPKIDGLTPGEHRDKLDQEEMLKAKGKARLRKGS